MEVTHNVKTFRFKSPNGGEIPFDYLPGQFLTLHIAPEGAPTKRSYTIASTPTWRDRIEITVKREDHGLVSRWLHDVLRPGDEVEIEAPNGTFTFTGKEAESVVLIGGGVGITPMMSVARYLTETDWPGMVHLIVGFRTPGDFIFRDEIAELEARNSNLRVTATMSRADGEGWHGQQGQIDTALLAQSVPEIASQWAHICGPPPMMDAVKAALIGLGLPEGQIRMEAFGTVKRDPTAKGAASSAVAGKVFFQSSNTHSAGLCRIDHPRCRRRSRHLHRQCLPLRNVRLVPREACRWRRAHAGRGGADRGRQGRGLYPRVSGGNQRRCRG